MTVLLSTTSALASKCELTVGVKKADAKTAYLGDGVVVSKKIQDALGVQCKLIKRVMSKSEVTKMNLLKAKKRYEKLLKESNES